MARFLIEVTSPDGNFTSREIRKALGWMMGHDGMMFRGFYSVKKVRETRNKSRVSRNKKGS